MLIKNQVSAAGLLQAQLSNHSDQHTQVLCENYEGFLNLSGRDACSVQVTMIGVF